MAREIAWDYVPAYTGVHLTSAAEVLRGAIAQLSGGPEKWVKGNFYDANGGACALGAIATAAYGQTLLLADYQRAESTLLTILREMHPNLEANTIPDLNDDPAVTYDDIMAAFEKAAMQLEEKVSG